MRLPAALLLTSCLLVCGCKKHAPTQSRDSILEKNHSRCVTGNTAQLTTAKTADTDAKIDAYCSCFTTQSAAGLSDSELQQQSNTTTRTDAQKAKLEAVRMECKTKNPF